MKIVRNTAIYNSAAAGASHGIDLSGGSHNIILGNTANYNGLNRAFDGGIRLTHSFSNNMINPADLNQVLSNTVSANCGDGITAGPEATNNTIASNTAKFNGIGTQDGHCDLPAPGKFHDLDEQLAGQGNVWNANNICHTQTANIPAGVCNPNE